MDKNAKVPAMTLNEYQALALRSASYPNIGNNVVYPTLGLVGESGEFAEQIKKMLRDDNGVMTPERKAKAIRELGDAQWYIGAIARELGVTLEEVAQANLDKLSERLAAGTIKGEGSDR